MADYGMKVSKDGFDIATAADKNLVFSSEFNELKRKTTGTATITATTTVAHGLAYTPIFFGLYSHDGTRFKMGYGGVDATNVVLDISSGTGVDWRYYIFYHTGV